MPSRRSSSSKPKRRARSGGSWFGVIVVACVIGIGFLISRGIIDLREFGIDPADVGFGDAATAQPDGSASLATGALEVFFTTPTLLYPDTPLDRIAPPYERALIADIDTAVRSIEFATFEYNLASIADALVRAQERGVSVRLALDRENLDNPVMSKWAGIVEEADIPISWQDSDAFLHSKFMIVDERLLWTGSWNATINDTYRNNNNLLRITLPALIDNYSVEFAQMDAGRFSTSKDAQTPHQKVRLGDITIENYFSPQDQVSTQIVERIDSARQSVEFMAFSFTSDPIAAAMIDRQRAGVPVRGVFENRNAQGVGSEYTSLESAGVGVLTDGNCYTMHHKVIIIDERVVITGSYNFTGRAENTNDENLLIIDDPALARAYHQEFERVYGQAERPTRCQ